MNRQNFNIAGGFPLETDNLDAMQKNCILLNALGEIAGDKAILKGCRLDAKGKVSDGVVYVGEEVLEFRGGVQQDTVVIKEDKTSKVFEDGELHEVLCERYMAFGSGEGALKWSEFKRYRFVEEVASLKADVKDKLAGINTKLDSKAPLEHNHDDRYYTQGQEDAFFEGESSGKKQVDWNRVTGKPSHYPPSTHYHDGRYYERGEIRDYGYLTDTVSCITSTGESDASFSDRVCHYVGPYQDSSHGMGWYLKLEFSRIKIKS